jgi:hypothetical protein
MLRPWVEVAERSGRAGPPARFAGAAAVRLVVAEVEPVRPVAEAAPPPAARLVARAGLAGCPPAALAVDEAVFADEAVFFAGLREERDDSGIRPVCSFAGWPQYAAHHVVHRGRYRSVI